MSVGNEVVKKHEELLAQIRSCNCIKFAAYRTASKLLVLHKCLEFSNISLQLIKGVFEHHHIRTTDNNLELSLHEVENILHDIFYAASKKEGNYDVESLVDITKLIISNIFIKRTEPKSISVLSLKVFLVSLCSSSLVNKYQYWFSQLMDHNLCLTRKKLNTLLKTLLLITDYLSESTTFSVALVEPTVESCFTEDHHSAIGISEYDYMTWLAKEPQLLVWLSTFYRLIISQKVTHGVQCSVCGVIPIVGLRYLCLRCIRYDLCQLCFFTGRTSKRHKSSHIIREYCEQTSFYKTTSAYLKEIFKRLWGNSEKLQYLPVNRNLSHKCENRRNNDTMEEEGTSLFEKKLPTEHDFKIRNELKEILSDIEKESSQLMNGRYNTSVTHLVNYEAYFLQRCLNRIKILQDELNQKKSTTCATQTSCENIQTLEKSVTCELPHRSSESSLFFPSPSRFSSWINEAQEDNTYTKQLQQDLDNIMLKLNNLLESTSSFYDENSESQISTKLGSHISIPN